MGVGGQEESDKTEDSVGPTHRPAPLWVRWRQDGTISSLVHGRVGSRRALPWTKPQCEPRAVGTSVCTSATCVHVQG